MKRGPVEMGRKNPDKKPKTLTERQEMKYLRTEEKLNNLLKAINPTAENPNKKDTDQEFERKLKMLDEMHKRISQNTTTKDDQVEEHTSSENMQTVPNTLKKPNKQRSQRKTYLDLEPTEKPFIKYYQMEFSEIAKRSLNPYCIIETIKHETGNIKPKQFTGYNRTSFTIQVQNEQQANKITKISQVAGHKCKVIPHPEFNMTKGVVFVEDTTIDNIDEFKAYLQQEHESLSNIIPATFIKTRNPTTKAYILEFLQDYLPYSIYVPGEKGDTIIRPWKNKPMMCKTCHAYNHPSKYCRKEGQICKFCGSNSHTLSECQANVPKCINCDGEHQAGDRSCPLHQHEEAIIEIQRTQKVNKMRARQIYANNNESMEKPKTKHQTYFDIEIDEEKKKKLSPWFIEKSISSYLDNKPKTIRTKNKTTFTIEVQTRQDSLNIMKIQSICGTPAKVTANESVGIIKGLVYIYGYNLCDFENFKEKLTQDLGLQNAEMADWIKPKNKNANALLLSFRGNLPNYIDIPGELTKTKVQEYKKRPLMCRRCQQYNHPEKYCAGEMVCGACGHLGHKAEGCSAPLRCPHCSLEHRAGNPQCVEYKFQEEIIAVQTKERVPRRQAIAMIERQNPSIKKNFAQALKQPSSTKRQQEKETREKSPETQRAIQELVVRSPSGRIYTTAVSLPNLNTIEHITTNESTSENSYIIREETRQIYEEAYPDAEQEDLDLYQQELNNKNGSKR